MAENEIIDDIIFLMKNEAEVNPLVDISPETLKDFFTDNKPTFNHQAQPDSVPGNSGMIIKESSPNEPSHEKDIANMNLAEMRDSVFKCNKCQLCQRRKHTVFGEGDENADLMFIGEGPGAQEDQQGKPFVGEAGMLLTKMINGMQFTREQVFIANIVKCRPPGNRTPEEQEMSACLPYIRRQIELINPQVIILLGLTPLRALLNKTGITRSRGQWFDYRGIKTIATFHPAYLLRYQNDRRPDARSQYQKIRRNVWDDLQKVMKIFGKVPSKSQKN